jgi:hypothetical protein
MRFLYLNVNADWFIRTSSYEILGLKNTAGEEVETLQLRGAKYFSLVLKVLRQS